MLKRDGWRTILKSNSERDEAVSNQWTREISLAGQAIKMMQLASKPGGRYPENALGLSKISS